jgi:ornithine cyclodeaminase/alanine dehydrogenase-like protein (mu-crystallin family)
MLYLGAEDLARAASLDQLMDAIENAYALERSGQYSMPNRIHLEHQGNTLLYMPCFLDKVFGTKVLNLFPDNPKQGLPVISGLYLLNDAKTGLPLAVLDGATVTAYRTGAVGGVAIRHTAPESANSVGLIGAGVQGFYQVLFASQARKLKQVRLFDRDRQKAEQLCQRFKKELTIPDIKVSASTEELLTESKIVITATPAREPVLPDDKKLLTGKNYVAIGSYKPEMRELPQSLYSVAEQLYIDTEHGLHESGDLITPLEKGWINQEQIISFSAYLSAGNDLLIEGKTTIFKSVGMALFDLVAVKIIYDLALEKNIGITLG